MLYLPLLSITDFLIKMHCCFYIGCYVPHKCAVQNRHKIKKIVKETNKCKTLYIDDDVFLIR